MAQTLVHILIIVIIIILIIWLILPKPQYSAFIPNLTLPKLNNSATNNFIPSLQQALFEIQSLIQMLKQQLVAYPNRPVPTEIKNFTEHIISYINNQVNSINAQIKETISYLTQTQIQNITSIADNINNNIKPINDTISGITTQKAKYIIVIPPSAPPATPECPYYPSPIAPIPRQPIQPPTPNPAPAPYNPIEPTQASVAIIVPIATINDPLLKQRINQNIPLNHLPPNYVDQYNPEQRLDQNTYGISNVTGIPHTQHKTIHTAISHNTQHLPQIIPKNINCRNVYSDGDYCISKDLPTQSGNANVCYLVGADPSTPNGWIEEYGGILCKDNKCSNVLHCLNKPSCKDTGNTCGLSNVASL